MKNVHEYILSANIDKVQKSMNEWNNLFNERKRDLEIRRRIHLAFKDKCGACEYGKFLPCKYKHWGFEIKQTDPACEDFEPFGIVY